MLKTRPLHPYFGVKVEGVNLARIDRTNLYPEIRKLFEKHSLLLFENQQFSKDDHIRLATCFGPLENREAMAARKDLDFAVSSVSNRKQDGSLYGPDEMRHLDLQANMLWHTDSTFLPTPALANILVARTIPTQGGNTEFASTRHGWAAMPPDKRAIFADARLIHRLSHSRARIDPRLATLPHITRWPDQRWKAVWKNPVTNSEALYIASHAFAIDGIEPETGARHIDDAIAFLTTSERVYSHQWKTGDVLIWDERAMLHRGTPWDYSQPRSLDSICVSATEDDGLNAVAG